MTFREFVESRKHVDDIASAIGQAGCFGDGPSPGYIYDDLFYIHDPRAGEEGEYSTEIENGCFEGPLHVLERRLYLFAAEQSPGWVDHDFVTVHTVMDEEDGVVGVIECVVDEGIRPRRVSDSLPPWIADWFLDNVESLPSNWESFGFRRGRTPFFMV